MIRKGLLVSALAAGALIGATPAQASVQFASVGGIINQLKSSSSFSGNNFSFAICQNGICQTQFTGLTGLSNYNGLGGLNSWANTSSYQSAASPFDNYRFTFSGVSGYFGNQSQNVPVQTQNFVVETTVPVPEPATWALMIFGFGLIGFAMRRRGTAVSFG
jgi:hypothetical protein